MCLMGIYILTSKNYQEKTMQIRPKKGITYKIQKKSLKYPKVIKIRLQNGKDR